VEGWNKTGKGRIYRIYDPEFVKEKAVRETKDLFAVGFDTLAIGRLTDLLSHHDMRVRQEAQFAIVAQGPVTAATTFTNLTRGPTNLFAKLHSIWGLGQIASRSQLAVVELNRMLDDSHPEMRAQAAKVLGSAGLGERKTFARLLSDENARVRFFAAMALAKVGNHETVPAIIEMLRANADQDVYLRHAGVMALASAARRSEAAAPSAAATITETSPDSLKMKKAFAPALTDKSDAVRMAALLALRRVESPDIAQFLQDANPLLVAEAARAINDIPITNALAKLAALIEQEDKLAALSAGDEKNPGPRDSLLRRVVNANYRVGGTNNALALAAFAATSKAPQAIREESLTLLGEWGAPSGRDRITGLWRPLPRRSPEVAAAALQPHLTALQQSSSDALKLAATKVAGRLHITGTGLEPIDIVNNLNAAANLRVEALKSMASNKDAKLGEAIRLSLADTNELLRKEATRLQAQMQPGDAVAQLRTTLESGSIGEQQNAFATLGAVTNAEADAVLSQWLDKLLAKDVKPELHLDLLDAAAKRESAEIKAKVRKFETARPAADDLRSYRECLVGGDAEEGKKVFLEKVEASCVRCHKLGGEGGEVGPEVTGIGARKDRQYLLESIVFPNKHIAEGFESVVVTLKNETAYAGQLKRETPEILEINSPEDGLIQVKKADIKARERGLSGMPEELRQVLTKHDLRNLVEFLAQLKDGK
jgi:quinoprotein glucose dehydrogenase